VHTPGHESPREAKHAAYAARAAALRVIAKGYAAGVSARLDEIAGIAGYSPLALYGIAHGRSWSSMGLLEGEELLWGDDNNVALRLTNSEQMVLLFALKALHSIECFRRRELLAGPRTDDQSRN